MIRALRMIALALAIVAGMAHLYALGLVLAIVCVAMHFIDIDEQEVV